MPDPTPPQTPAAPVAPAPGTPEYDAAMIAKFDAATGAASAPATPEPAARPEWLPEKFKSVEDFVKSYGELEKKLGAGSTPAPATTPAATPAAPAVDPSKATPAAPTKGLQVAEGDAAAQAVTDAGFDMKALQSEFAEHGDLKPETRTALESKFGKDVVDSYIAGQQALANQYVAKVHEAAGGEQQLGQMLEWAKAGLSQAEKVAFNEATASGNIDKANLAVAGLKARFEAANGSLPNLIGGASNAAVDAPYESMAQIQADMRKQEYKTDPAFRAKVERRISQSNLWTAQER